MDRSNIWPLAAVLLAFGVLVADASTIPEPPSARAEAAQHVCNKVRFDANVPRIDEANTTAIMVSCVRNFTGWLAARNEDGTGIPDIHWRETGQNAYDMCWKYVAARPRKETIRELFLEHQSCIDAELDWQ